MIFTNDGLMTYYNGVFIPEKEWQVFLMSFAWIRENNIPCDSNARVQDHLRESQTRLSERDVSEWKGRGMKISKPFVSLWLTINHKKVQRKKKKTVQRTKTETSL